MHPTSTPADQHQAPQVQRPPLFIAHARELILAGLVAIASDRGFRVSGVAATAAAALAGIRSQPPGVAIVDGFLSGGAGFAVARDVAAMVPRVRVILFGAVGDETHLARARALGAVNCLTEASSADDIATAVGLASAGRRPVPPDPFAEVARKLDACPDAGADSHLTPRERQVLRHLAFGLDNEEIAAALSIGIETVKSHVHKLLRKTDLRDRTQAAIWAVKHGLA